MKSLFLLISSTFFYTFLIKFGNIQGLNKAGMKVDVASRRVEAKMEERDSGVRVVRWPTLTFCKLPKAHGLPNMVNDLDLQTRQLPSLWDRGSALTFKSPNMVNLGGCPAHFCSNQLVRLQTSGDVMENSITPHCNSMWQGNSTPVSWSTFWVQILRFKWVFPPGGIKVDGVNNYLPLPGL